MRQWLIILYLTFNLKLLYSLSTFYHRSVTNNHKINPRPCSINGLRGTCMFVWECINTEGHHIGMCVDTFMFGSCCAHNLTSSELSSLPNLPELPAANTQHKLKPKPSTTVRPAFFLSGNEDSSFDNQMRPNLDVNMYHSSNNNNIDRVQNGNDWNTAKPFLHRPIASQHFHDAEDHISSATSQQKQPVKVHASPTASVIKTTTTTTTTMVPKYQYFYNYSSHYATTTQSWNSQNMESNEIDDSPNHMEGVIYNKPSSLSTVHSPTPSFITKPKPPSISSSIINRFRPWTTSSTAKPYLIGGIPTGVNITKLQTTKPFHANIPPVKPNTTLLSAGQPLSASVHERNTQCGVSPLHPRHEVRIVGGRNAQFGVWAWQVSVRRTSFFGFSSTHRCGGALLNENWIATAGHCVDDLLTSQIRIRVGEYDFSSVQEPYPFAERGVARKVVHPKYNFFTYEYDLAVVKLDSPLEYAPHIVPICLPGSDDLLIGENATVTGWGRLSEGGTLPSVLQEVSVPIVSNDKCKSMFLRSGRHEYIPDIFMCAGFDNGGRDSCQGDSGGPLQVRGKDGRYFLAGIISWGIGCAEANLPGVCTRISKFVPWILQTVT